MKGDGSKIGKEKEMSLLKNKNKYSFEGTQTTEHPVVLQIFYGSFGIKQWVWLVYHKLQSDGLSGASNLSTQENNFCKKKKKSDI